jgi:hypothetical protein
MASRRIVLLVLFCVGAIPELALPGQDLQPVHDPHRRIEIPGVSVLPPQGEKWFLFPVSAQEGNPPDSMIRFVQRIQSRPPRKPDEARSVLAGVVAYDSGKDKSRTPAEFLEEFTGRDPQSQIGQMMTSRQRLVAFEAALDGSLGATCVKYRRVTEITGQFPMFPGLVAMSSTRGLNCLHPQWPRYQIDITFQQLYAKGEAPLPLDAASESFLKGVVFTAARPSAINVAK